jgi:ABC-type transport system involved in multi-copper enzyme maturation permease subunit
MTWARLTFRLQPSSIGFAALVCLGLAGAAAWLTLSLPSMTAECEAPAAPDNCGLISVFGSPLGEPVMLLQLGMGLAMYAVPLVLGVPVLTSEIERGTAMIAWPLAGSRLKWLAWRAGSVLVVGLVLIGVMAFAAESMAGANEPGEELGFLAHGTRGISLMTRAGLMLVVAVALGAAIGRLLPSLLIGIALAVGLSIALDSLPPYGVAPTELMLSGANFEGGHPFQTGHAYRAPDGTPITDDEAEAMLTAVYEEYSPNLPPSSVLPQDVFYGIAGSRYFEVLGRETAVLVGTTVLVAGVAAAVVQRRRPE